jgi:tetratricopeptide (TPR) repeat protein
MAPHPEGKDGLTCQACGELNTSRNHYCGNCGKPLGEADRVYSIVEQILATKYKSDKFVEAEAAERVRKRLLAWSAPLLVALSIFGFDKWTDFSKVVEGATKKIEEKSQSAEQSVSSLEGKVTGFQGEIEKRRAALTDADKVLGRVAEIGKEIRTVQASVKEVQGATKESYNLAVAATRSSSQAAPSTVTSTSGSGLGHGSTASGESTGGSQTSDQQVEQLFNQVKTNEYSLSRAAHSLFDQGNYKNAIRFYSEARAVESSGVWQSDYPYFAAAYWFLGDKAKFSSTLQEMIQKVTSGSGYFSSRTPVTFVLRALGDVQSKIDDDSARKTLDQYIDLVRERLQKMPQF